MPAVDVGNGPPGLIGGLRGEFSSSEGSQTFGEVGTAFGSINDVHHDVEE
jgi:hypothetical protein